MNTPSPTDPADGAAPACLDADILALLADGQSAEPMSPLLAARIKHRLMRRVAESEVQHLTVQAGEDSWQPFQPGVAIKVLHEAEGIMSYLLRLAPGAVIPAHRHPVDEECMVLEGTLHIGAELVVPAGGFHLARRDALHAPITSVTGATIFLRGASPHPADLV
jgi:anti-sigma factor ChrR (cupin superfamily)